LSSEFQLYKYFNPLQETNYASAETYFEEPLNDQQNPIADLHRESINEEQQVLADKVQESSREPTDTTATINVQSDPLFVTVI
jgi:hypothetical protein